DLLDGLEGGAGAEAEPPVLGEEDAAAAASSDPEAGAGVVGALLLPRLELGRPAGPAHRGGVLEGVGGGRRAEGAVVLGRLPQLAAVVDAELRLAHLRGGGDRQIPDGEEEDGGQ